MKITDWFTSMIRAGSLREGLKILPERSLYINAYYLMADVIVVSVLGFAFWTLVARLYSPAEVGLASATIAAVIYLARLSRLGFGYGLIRFLPDTGEKAAVLISTCFTITGLISMAAALVFLSGLNLWSPAILYLHTPGLFIFFVALATAYTLFLLVEQAFIAERRAGYVLLKNTVAGIIKILAAILFASLFSTSGIFLSWGMSIFIALAAALFLFLPRLRHGYLPVPAVNKEMVSSVLHFSLGNYFAELLWFTPLMVFPLIVINILGAELNAYFYMPWTIAQMLFAIPMAVSMSLFAEGSYDERSLRENVKKSVYLCLLILVPALVILFPLSDKLLLLFGNGYSENGATLLRTLVVSVIPVGIIHISLSAMRVKKNVAGIIIVSFSVAFLSLLSGYILVTRMGLPGIGIAWLATQTLIAISVVLFLFYKYRLKDSSTRYNP